MRTRLACALVALLGVLLLTGADTFQVVNPSGVASAEYDTSYTIVGTSPATTRTAGAWVAWNAAAAAKKDSVKTGVAWAMPRAGDSAGADTISNYPQSLGSSFYNDFYCREQQQFPPSYGPATIPMLRLPYTARSDRDVVQAILCLYFDATNRLVRSASGDTTFIIADTTTTNHSLFVSSVGIGRWPSSPAWPTRTNTSYTTIKSGTNWSPTLASINRARKHGVVKAFTGATAAGGWVGFDVTDLVDDFSTINFFAFMNRRASGNAYIQFGHPDDAVKATRPFLLVKTFAKTRRAGPWPGGAQVAAAIQCDDGKRAGWMAYDSVATVYDVNLTYSLEVNNVFNYSDVWVTPDDIRYLYSKGHEIQNQGWFSRARCVGQETGFTRGCYDCTGTAFLATMTSALAVADSITMHADSSYYWARKWITADETVNLDWRPRTFAYGSGANTAALEDSLAARGYYGARDAAGTSFVMMWASGYPFKITEPLAISQIAGAFSNGSNANNEATTRAVVRALVNQYRYGGPYANGILSFYVHSPSEDCDREHFGWIIDELLDQGVYFDTMSNLLNYWRRHHSAVNGADPADQWASPWGE